MTQATGRRCVCYDNVNEWPCLRSFILENGCLSVSECESSFAWRRAQKCRRIPRFLFVARTPKAITSMKPSRSRDSSNSRSGGHRKPQQKHSPRSPRGEYSGDRDQPGDRVRSESEHSGSENVWEHSSGRIHSQGQTSQQIEQRTVLAPDPRSAIPTVELKSFTLHPLLYKKRLGKVERAKPGDLVAVYQGQGQLFGYGIYNPRSEIGVRMLWHGDALPTDESWNAKLKSAVSLRHDLLRVPAQSNSYRLIHAESDGLPGLVVDRFGDVLSAEAFSLGMYQRSVALLERLMPLTGTSHWMVRTSPQFLSQEGCDPPELKSPECPSQVVIQESGVRFRVRFDGSHKTGFFCDQREITAWRRP